MITTEETFHAIEGRALHLKYLKSAIWVRQDERTREATSHGDAILV